ncbi:hypothetical protein QAD02_003834 [Eretmocerus hayati]|uniref:Uncharacterized protein n=1 Tax=Eretmocerus hayati TaxID=131215 RepID=A0ACC2NN23_9HYME|nr:hypothetical protein QAD02_003834 [Eretmocerus hayati]
MGTPEKVNLRVLELAKNSDCDDYEDTIIAPASWIGFDDQRKVLTVKYLFPPREDEDESLFKGIFKSRVLAPEAWPSYPISKELGEASTLKAAEKILKDYRKGKKEPHEKDPRIQALEKTSMNPADIPSLTQHPTLFAQESMKGSVISGNFLQSIENGINSKHNSSAKPVQSPCVENNGKRRKSRGKQTDNAGKKSSPKKLNKRQDICNQPSVVLEPSEQVTPDDSPNLMEIDGDDSEIHSDQQFQKPSTPTDEIEESVEASETEDSTTDPSNGTPVVIEDCSNTDIPNSSVIDATDTGPMNIVEVTPVQMNDLATKQDIADFKEWMSRRLNSQAQQITANNNVMTEVKNILKSKETDDGGRNIILLDDLKSRYNLSLPFSTVEQFKNFDTSLTGLAIRQDLGEYFRIMINSEKAGKTSMREILKSFCRRAVIQDHYIPLKVTKGNPKEAFISTNFGTLLYDNARVKLQLDESIIRDSISKVILGMEDWEGGRAERDPSRKSGDNFEKERRPNKWDSILYYQVLHQIYLIVLDQKLVKTLTCWI